MRSFGWIVGFQLADWDSHIFGGCSKFRSQQLILLSSRLVYAFIFLSVSPLPITTEIRFCKRQCIHASVLTNYIIYMCNNTVTIIIVIYPQYVLSLHSGHVLTVVHWTVFASSKRCSNNMSVAIYICIYICGSFRNLGVRHSIQNQTMLVWNTRGFRDPPI